MTNDFADLESIAQWTVSYEAENVIENSIDAGELASSLLSIRQLCLRSNEIMNGGTATASLRVIATNAGSFDVHVALAITLIAGMHALSGDYVSAAVNLKYLLTGNPGAMGIIGAFRHLRGRSYITTEINQDSVTLEANELRLNIPVEVFSLFQDRSVKEALNDMIEPLKQHSVTKITFRDGDEELVSLESNDFDDPEYDDPSDETENVIDIPIQRLRVASPNLENRTAKWRLNDGNTTRWYSIHDEDFMQKVTNGDEKFGAGDVLTCHVNIVQTLHNDSGFDSDYRIIKVLDHSSPGRQLSFNDG